MCDLPERLTRAFVDLFASNVFRDWTDYEGGGPGYYGVRIENVAPDGAEVDLVLTFLPGKRYCCFEFADHFAHDSERGGLDCESAWIGTACKGYRCREFVEFGP